jgi:two-component system response regulator HydG
VTRSNKNVGLGAMPTLDEVEREHVMRVLKACGHNQALAARLLHLDRKTLARRLRRWFPPDASSHGRRK